jgi:hypothetical protein
MENLLEIFSKKSFVKVTAPSTVCKKPRSLVTEEGGQITRDIHGSIVGMRAR